MHAKAFISVILIVFLCSMYTFGGALSVAAEKSNVIDWVNDEQPSQQPDSEENDENETLTSPEEKSFAVVIGQLFLYTLLILVLIYGLIKFLSVRQKKLQPNQAVQLMGGTSLGSNKSLQLVKVGNSVYLLGVADSVTLIKEFSSQDEINQIEQDLDKQPLNVTKSLLQLTKRKDKASADDEPNQAFQQLFNQSLYKQRNKQDQLKQDLYDNDDDKGRSP